MTVSMLSLAGIPVTAGFFAKYFVFTTVIGTPYQWLLILAVITSAVGAYYYLKIVIAMYFKEQQNSEAVGVENWNKFVIAATTVLTLVIGLLPGFIAEMFSF
jgi:NADH-quinone oxidoreductase subunit N